MPSRCDDARAQLACLEQGLPPPHPCRTAPPPPVCSQAAAKLWPDVFATPEAEACKEELVEKMRVVRPVVETGCVFGRRAAKVPGSRADCIVVVGRQQFR